MSIAVPENRDNLQPDSNHSFVTVIPVDFSRHRGFPQPPDQYSDYVSHDSDFTHLENTNNQLEDMAGNGNLFKASGLYNSNSDWENNDKLKETVNDAITQSIKVCVYLMSDLALHMEVEDGANATVQEFVQAIVCDEQLRIPRFAANIFTLWMSSGLLGA